MEGLINNLLRPYRSSYSLSDLGRRKTDWYARLDDHVLNDRDQRLQYSYFQQVKPTDVCVVYCHCNSGSRMQGVQYVEHLTRKGWNVCLFDFAGSGLSQGSHISLGHYESKDLECVIQKLRLLGNRKFLLWGRSMGAATIIFYLNQAKYRDDIVGCVLDSPYASLWSLMKQIGIEKSIFPGFIIEHVMDYLRERIKQEYCFDIKKLQPLRCMAHLNMPLLFITSLIDDFVKSEDVVQLYRTANCRNKQIEYIDKAHNSSRDNSTIDMAIVFLHKCLIERSKRRKQMSIFLKNNKDLTGSNMADLIIKAEREKTKMRRMKSEVNINRSCKENRPKNINSHMKTEFTCTTSVILENESLPHLRSRDGQKRRTIKCSLAHIEHQKKSLIFKIQPSKQ